MLKMVGVGAVLSLVAFGCGGAPKRWGGGGGKTNAAPAAEPQKVDYDALSEREVSGTYPVHPVTALSGSFTAQLQATAPADIKSGAGGDGTPESTLTFRIGSAQPVTCTVRGARADAGMWIQQKLDDIKKVLDQRGIQGRFGMPDVGVEVEGNHPVMYVDVPVAIGAGAQERKGLLKLAVSPRDGGSVLCLHDEVGYKKTFRKVVGALVTSANVTGDRPQPVYTEIGVAKVEGKTVGFAELYEYLEGAQTRTVQVISIAANKKLDGKPTWVVSDAVRSTIATTKGEVQSIKSIVAQNKKTVTSIELKRGKAGNDYVYDGTVNGTKVKGSFMSPRPIETEGALALRMQNVASGKAKDLKYLVYAEDVKIEGPIEVTATREDPKTISHKSEDGRVWTTTIDALGLPERTMYSRDKDGERLSVERAYSQGQPSATAGKKPLGAAPAPAAPAPAPAAAVQ